MAVSTATITVFDYPKGFDNTQRMTIVRGTIKVVAGTYPPGGFPLSWTNVTNQGGEMIRSIPVGSTTPASTGSPFPVECDIFSSANRAGTGGVGPSGFIYLWDSVLGNMHIFEAANGASNNSGPLLEIGGNLPGDVVNDNIQFTAYFSRVD